MVNELIHKYCEGNEPLEQVLLRHSEDVARRALKIAKAHPELGADETFLWEAAMLHDIGCVRTNAPSIHCFGTEPYIRHGLLGGEILRGEGLPRHARVAERHTGTGLTAIEIERQNLPLPCQDFTPESIEEQIVCYADKFFSKTKLDREKTMEEVVRSLAKFGTGGVARFQQWAQTFE